MFNSNFIVVFIIINNYKFNSIPYYIIWYLILIIYRTGALLVPGSILGATRNISCKKWDF